MKNVSLPHPSPPQQGSVSSRKRKWKKGEGEDGFTGGDAEETFGDVVGFGGLSGCVGEEGVGEVELLKGAGELAGQRDWGRLVDEGGEKGGRAE